MSAVVDVVVVGGGLAGSATATELASRGLKVLWCSGAPGGSAFWSGLTHLHGPTLPLPEPTFEAAPYRGQAPAMTPTVEPTERLAKLAWSAPEHPLVRNGATVAEVREAAERLAKTLALPIRFQSRATPWVTFDATLRHADGALETMAPASELRGATVVPLAGVPRFSPSWVASSLSRLHGTPSLASQPEQNAVPAISIGSALQAWRTRPLAKRAEALAAMLDNAGVRMTSTVLLPALPALEFHEAQDLVDLVRARNGITLAETPGTAESVAGVRLLLHLRALAPQGVTRHGPLKEAPVEELDGWSVHTDSGVVLTRAIVLATGDTLGQGSQCSWVSALSESDQHPTPPPPATPWQRMPEWSGGVHVDRSMRVLRGGQPIDNLYAVGTVVAGQDPALDETTFGVTAWSVQRAVKALLEAL